MVRDLGLTSQQVWGLTKTNQGWSTALEAALTAARRDDLEHGTNAAYTNRCVCRDCREHQQRRMGRRLTFARRTVTKAAMPYSVTPPHRATPRPHATADAPSGMRPLVPG